MKKKRGAQVNFTITFPTDIWSTREHKSRMDRSSSFSLPFSWQRLFFLHLIFFFFSGVARSTKIIIIKSKIKNPRWRIPTQKVWSKKIKKRKGGTTPHYSIDTTGSTSFSSSSSAITDTTPSSIDRRHENSANDGWIIQPTIKERADLWQERIDV